MKNLIKRSASLLSKICVPFGVFGKKVIDSIRKRVMKERVNDSQKKENPYHLFQGSIVVFILSLINLAFFRTGWEVKEIVYAFLHTFIYAWCCWLIYSWLMNTRMWNRPTTHVLAKTGTALLLGLFLSGRMVPYDALFSHIFPNNILSNLDHPSQEILLLLQALSINSIIYAVLYHITLPQKQKKVLEAEQLKQAQLQANISTLKEQLSPHFLFNTLNTLSLLTNEEPVREFVDKLANTYRYTLKHQVNDVTTLKQELEFVEDYMYIIQKRLENAIEMRIDINEEVLSSPIPPFTLQLLVENAIKHNEASSSQPLKIRLYNLGNESLSIENNFQPKLSVLASTGMGLKNIRNRYQLLFGKEIKTEHTDDRFRVELPIIHKK